MTGRTDFIIPECFIDTNLAETLTGSGGCNHQKGCNQVAKIMQDKFADRFAVGIIDADKRRPGYLNEFRIIAGSLHLEVLHHTSRPHFIVLVHPAADGFILDCASEAGIDVSDYELSPILKEFTTQTKDVLSNKDVRFKRLFKALQGGGEMALLKALLNYLANNNYASADAEIAGLLAGV